ncbi:hypothetical protein GNY06_00990 [Elizabethkingia argentiflava]|uniref:Type VI secretion system baseplate subunit TssK n=1 Tax=Elizabethkingia argenteiflava TaxID=2681556 RepID=A0A845PQV6_9FLAO|nr:type VI secretion system baseplate subunit TssK [Elizabethkingia argenteiflava]NAW50025.1 hypothetical protein [Elizabethkingia argenteiflava]
MIQPIKNHAVNWADGMKVSERHLKAHDNFIQDTIRDSNSLGCNSFNYGLLPISMEKNNEESIFDVYSSPTKDVQLVIKHCSALTLAGYRIALSDYKTNIKSLMKSAEGHEEGIGESFYILVSSDPFQRVPFGDIDSDEIPPRHPFTDTKYTIELIPESTLASTGGNYIIIGKVNIKGDIAEADQNFIPPCTNIHSHPALLSYYNSFAKSMGNLQQYALTIIQKAINTNQNSVLANNVKTLCHSLINHIAHVYFNYRNIVPHQPPIYMIEVFSGMALHIYYSTQVLAKGELEEMLNYSYEWSDVAPHTLLNQLSAVTEINYNHNNCGEHLHEIQRLLKSLEIIFSKLSSLDYIGQRKENIIVNEQDITPTNKIKKGWSLLD